MPVEQDKRGARTWAAVLVVVACACLVVGVGGWVLTGKSGTGGDDPAAATIGPNDLRKGEGIPTKDGGVAIHLGDNPIKPGEKRKIARGGGYIEITPVEGAPPVKPGKK